MTVDSAKAVPAVSVPASRLAHIPLAVMSLLACYEILRRGNDANKQMLRGTVVPNLEQYFGGIPDIAAIATLLDLPRPMPAGAPIFRDGLLAYPDWEDRLPMPADDLDFNYVWTAWRGRRGCDDATAEAMPDEMDF